MGIGLIFWILMLIWLVFGVGGLSSDVFRGNPRFWFGNALFLFVLFFLLGWQSFGFMIQGPHR